MTSLDFAEAARRLAEATRRAGHVAPGFRSPPRSAECRRSIRRRRNGGAVIAVQVKQRPPTAVLADMIDGVIVANQLAGPAGADLRDLLWAAAADVALPIAPLPERSAEVRAIRAA